MRTNKQLLNEISEYVKERYVSDDIEKSVVTQVNKTIELPFEEKYSSLSSKDISNIRNKAKSATTWQTAVFNYIIQKGYNKDSDVYKRAYISKQLFSKIRCKADYKPDKDTAIKMCIGLKLSLDESIDLLKLAGHTFVQSNVRDLVIQFFISKKIFNVSQINDALYDMKEKILPISS